MSIEAGGDHQEIRLEAAHRRNHLLGVIAFDLVVFGARLERNVEREAEPSPLPVSLAAPVPG